MPADKSSVAERVREITERVAASEGLEIVDVEWHGGGAKGVLRIYIDKPSGVTHADCEAVSKQVSTILDVEDVVPVERYFLEVSSPGLDRKLLKPDDYLRFAGKKAKIRLKTEIAGRQQYTGLLRGFEEDMALLEVGPEQIIRFSLDDVRTARLVIDLQPTGEE